MNDDNNAVQRSGDSNASRMRRFAPFAVVFAAVIVVGFVLLGLKTPTPSEHPAAVRRDTEPQRIRRSFDGDGPINVTRDGVAIKGYDVVAYFTVGEPVKGSSEFEADYKNATFRFASRENRQRFLDDPEAYMPAYGGYCALGVANGYKDDMHPQAFDIVKGRLFFNLTPSIGYHWRQHQDNAIARADENWPELRNAPGYGPTDAR